jgi:glutaconate CoA-transferase subunit B
MTARLVDQVICAASEAWRDAGEVLATGIGLVPRLAASLAMRSSNPDLMMTDSEAWIVSEPVPVGPRGDYPIRAETWMGFSRIFSNVWGGKRHAMVGPTQIDRFGQANISCIGDYAAPKVQMLGVRGFPGNSISHPNSFFVPSHSTRVFVEGEVDMVSSIGYNPERLPRGYRLDDIAIGRVITNLGVLDFGGPDHRLRLLSVHDGVSVDSVIENTGFDVHIEGEVPTTAAPSEQQLALLHELDPHDLRAKALG